MQPHPENSEEINELITDIGKMETVEVWCHGCNDFTPVNASYAKYLQGEVQSCSRCKK